MADPPSQPLEPSKVLEALSASDDPLLSDDAFPAIPPMTVKSTLDRLGSREMVTYKQINREAAVLTEEGSGIADNGSHEAKVFEAVLKAVEGIKIAELPVRGANCMPAGLDFLQDLGLTLIRISSERTLRKLDRAKP